LPALCAASRATRSFVIPQYSVSSAQRAMYTNQGTGRSSPTDLGRARFRNGLWISVLAKSLLGAAMPRA
jgi:hypothetical protein